MAESFTAVTTQEDEGPYSLGSGSQGFQGSPGSVVVEVVQGRGSAVTNRWIFALPGGNCRPWFFEPVDDVDGFALFIDPSS